MENQKSNGIWIPPIQGFEFEINPEGGLIRVIRKPEYLNDTPDEEVFQTVKDQVIILQNAME